MQPANPCAIRFPASQALEKWFFPFSRQFRPICAQWSHPLELHGIGQYAADAYFIFCRGEWAAVAPLDKDLLKYHTWLQETQGLGTGLSRDPPRLLAPIAPGPPD